MRRIPFRDYWVFLIDLISGRRLRSESETADLRKVKTRRYLDYSQPLDVLDLGSGELQPQSILLASEGHRVVGVDLANGRRARSWERSGYRFARWFFWRSIDGRGRAGGRPRLVCADAARLPIRSSAFDLVTSIAAFEHFLDMPGVIAELGRVVRPGGIVFAIIHPFTALSGGHNVQLMDLPIRALPEGVEPWDHLRARRLPITVPLNEWRIGKYLSAFEGYFELVEHGCWMPEGEGFLTAEIEEDLPGYSREELLWGTYYIVARRPVTQKSTVH